MQGGKGRERQEGREMKGGKGRGREGEGGRGTRSTFDLI